MNYRFQLHYRITLNTALALQSGSGRGAFHQTIMRDRQGFLIPASSQKGRLRFYCKRILNLLPEVSQAELCDLEDQLFGNVLNRLDGAGVKRRNLLFFENAYISEAFSKHEDDAFLPTEARSRIKINRRTGSVDGQHLAFFEAVPRNLVFDACIEGYLGKGKPGSDPALGLLLSAIGIFDRLGSNQSRGFGSVQCRPHRFVASTVGQEPVQVNADTLETWRKAFIHRYLKEVI
jgi:CRISPR/Cas system CSM-associated protein Csm3 (group 7 of RAMP superfamily)